MDTNHNKAKTNDLIFSGKVECLKKSLVMADLDFIFVYQF